MKTASQNSAIICADDHDLKNVNSLQKPPQTALDLVHLSRQTMGDFELEREILGMFRTQCETCRGSLEKHIDPQQSCNPQQLAQIAHHMKGCARAVGAWDVAARAALLEENSSQLHLILPLRDEINLVEKILDDLD